MPTLRLREPEGALPNVLMPAWDTLPVSETDAPGEDTVAVPRGDAGAAPPLDIAQAACVAEDTTVPAVVATGPFEVFVATLTQVALRRSSPRSAAALQALLEHGRLAPGALDEGATRALVGKRVLDANGRQPTPEFRAATDAWRGVLEGTAADLSACGDRTLDVWAAELVAALVSTSSADTAELRRELRRAGVAAFGLLAVA